MNESFIYTPLAGRIVFGAGTSRRHLVSELDRLGVERVLLIAARAERTLAHELTAPLGARVVDGFADVHAHVPVTTAKSAREAARASAADCLLSIGGGSTVGAAKAVALTTELPIVAIPTTYAGSEMTPIYGITDGRSKQTGTAASVLPRVVIYDPELTLSLPAAITGYSAMNAMAHAVEALYAPAANPVTALIAEEAIRALAASIPAALAAPEELGPRHDIQWGAYLAASALAVAGTSLHHKICHVLGGAYDLPHAQLHAIVLPHVVALKEMQAGTSMERVAAALGTDHPSLALDALVKQVPGPHALTDVGLSGDDLEEAVRLVAAEVDIDRDTVEQIVSAAYIGAPPGQRSPDPQRS